ncbi:MAG TPA: 2Fe-2S iron-sulfur cluster binding domain-containing protein [Polyangiaceae bacterium]|nr:2Fe-2S iron-sulfur cluster binding domain-containing protein [Polyangiaceae bacterium]
MAIHFEGKEIELLPDETVLEGLERQGWSLPAFCRQGVCQCCMMKAKSGPVPAAAQKGLKDGQRLQSLFLACVCRPTPDQRLELERFGSSQEFTSRVERVERLTEQVLRVSLALPSGFVHRAGQYLQLVRPSDGLMRPYSIASLPGEALELHVALMRGGAMSGWLRSAAGEPVTLRGPFGDCFYFDGEPERPLCLAGNGTGLAPLLGVLRAALSAGHRGPLRLYHGSLRPEGLYLWQELCALAQQAPQLKLIGSLLEGTPGSDTSPAERCALRLMGLDQAVLEDGVHAEERVYLCGNPDLVRKLQRKLYLAGVPLARIHADPFVGPPVRS